LLPEPDEAGDYVEIEGEPETKYLAAWSIHSKSPIGAAADWRLRMTTVIVDDRTPQGSPYRRAGIAAL